MSTGRPMTHRYAARLGAAIRHELLPHCEAVEVCGGVRRLKPVVTDLDIICVPRVEERSVNLLGDTWPHRPIDDLLTQWIRTNRITPFRGCKAGFRHCSFSVTSVSTDTALKVELYVATPETFGMWVLLRTGPAELSNRLVTPRTWTTRGGLPGLLPLDLEVRDGFGLYRRADGVQVPTRNETEALAVLGLTLIPPENRTPQTWFEEGTRDEVTLAERAMLLGDRGSER